MIDVGGEGVGRPPGTLDSLLEPSLQGPPPEPLYSVRANFLVAFFGGVYAAALFGALNAQRMGRLARDVWIYALVATTWSAVGVWAGYAIMTETLPGWLSEVDVGGRPGRTLRFAGRAVSLALFGSMYLRQRVCFKAQELAGVTPAGPWRAALVCSAVSIVLSMAMFGIGAVLGRG